jgi:hypothetical protein
MTFTNAQKQKRYRENLKAKGLYQAMKAKHSTRMRIYRENLTDKKNKIMINDMPNHKEFIVIKTKTKAIIIEEITQKDIDK